MVQHAVSTGVWRCGVACARVLACPVRYNRETFSAARPYDARTGPDSTATRRTQARYLTAKQLL